MPSPFPNLPPYLRGSVRVLDHSSRQLRDNPWGDPSHRDLWVYTPPGYDADEARRYPAVLLLPGYAGTGEGLLARSLGETSIASRIDRLIHGLDENGGQVEPCPPFLAVLPDCMTTLGGSQYVDSPALGNYASYLLQEVMPFVDGRFRTTGQWAAAGRSSGGFGALHLAMTAPGAFEAVACHAGDMGFDLCYLAEIPRALGPIQAAGGPLPFLESFWGSRQPSHDAFASVSLLCLAAAYSPDLEAHDFPARLPVDWRTGEVRFDVLQGWRALDPVVRADDPRAQQALSRLKLLFLDAGSRDEHGLHLGARRLVARLQAHGIAHTYEEFPGGHRGTSWRYDVSLPALVRAMIGAATPPAAP